MDRACTSDSETARLRALDSYRLLDTPRERDFDEIAEAAAELCDAPIAVVNLVGDGRQFFKAEVGLGMRETPRHLVLPAADPAGGFPIRP